jgi:hypothetical protein
MAEWFGLLSEYAVRGSLVKGRNGGKQIMRQKSRRLMCRFRTLAPEK